MKWMSSDYEAPTASQTETSRLKGPAWETLELSLPRRFEFCVKAFGDLPAVVEGESVWSYDRLNRAANRVARTLVTTRGREAEPVAVLFAQGANFLAGLLGVLKAGKFYVPLDPLFPRTRNETILKDAGAELLLTEAQYLTLAKELSGGLIPVLDVGDCGTPGDEANLDLQVPPDALGVLIYTSGSTGQPKGVLHNQRTLIHNSVRQHDLMQFSPDDRLTMLYSSSVMSTVRDYTNALLNGASLYPFDIRTQGLANLVDLLEAKHITIIHTIPSVFRHLGGVLEHDRKLDALRFVILGGETLLRADFEISRRHFPSTCRLFTGLGMTETGTVRQNILTTQTVVEGPVVPLGYPLRDVEIRLHDEAGNPVKAGEVGEIVVRSPYIALEYWHRPEETRAAFATDPAQENVRLFRTSDLGEQLPDGCLVHRGRKDTQVKVRGFRIELEEIESVLLETGLVKDAAVIGHDVRPGDKRLVAYVVPQAGGEGKMEELRHRLDGRLPDHMVPTLFVEMEELPHTPNGKVDRQGLPHPDFGNLAGGAAVPADAIEAALADLWKEVLSTEAVGFEDNFFDLGGDSLLACEMFIQIDRRFGRLYPLSLLIEKNTVRQLAEVLRDPNSGITRSLVAVKPEGSRPPVFVIPGGYGDVLYLRALARHISPDQPIYGLQAAGREGFRQYSMHVEEIAAQYLVEIAEVQARGPYLLAGHSFGGYVAVEMARLLGQRGERVALLAILDTYPPGERRQATPWNRLLIHLENLRGLHGKQKLAYVSSRLGELVLRLSHNQYLAGLVSREGSLTQKAVAYSRLARYTYTPAPYPGSMVLFKASQRPWYVTWDPMEKWSEYVSGTLESEPVQGRHESILFEPNVKDLAAALDRRIRQALDGTG